jgi:hypothetical protein
MFPLTFGTTKRAPQMRKTSYPARFGWSRAIPAQTLLLLSYAVAGIVRQPVVNASHFKDPQTDRLRLLVQCFLSLGCFAQRARAAFRAPSLRCSAVSRLALAVPPFFPNLAKYFLIPLRLREPSERLRKIFKTSFVRKGVHLIHELFLPLCHVVVRISREYASAVMSRLRHKGFHDTLSSFAGELPDEVFGKAWAAEGQTWNRVLNQRCDIARASFIDARRNCEDESKRRILEVDIRFLHDVTQIVQAMKQFPKLAAGICVNPSPNNIGCYVSMYESQSSLH